MFLTWLHRKLWQPSPSRRQRRPAVRGESTPPRLEPLEDRLLLSTYLVTNTNDSGDGSLRQAILNVNNGSGGDTVAFNIGGGGVQTIQPTSALPTITKSVTIDGTTQPGYSGTPLIVVNGSLFNNGPNGYGFDITASNVTVRGLDINGFTGSQIRLEGAGKDVIAGDYLGTDVTGTKAISGSPSVANDGLFVLSPNNTIGGMTAADRNLISGSIIGVFISGTATTGNVVEGNYIGTDVSGANPLANSTGVELAASHSTVADNVISGNSDTGLLSIDSVDNVIQGNLIGTDATGTKAVANNNFGMQVFGDINDTIGGTAAGAGNLISGNKGVGLDIEGSQGNGGGLQIEGNLIGTDITGTKGLGNATGIVVGAPNVLIGGTDTGSGNLVSGNTSFGVLIEAAGVKVVGNRIGTDVTGTKAVGNQIGVTFSGFGIANAIIGGTEAGAGNVISGNGQTGIAVASTSPNATVTGILIEGNLIGTNAAGTGAVGNGVGISVVNASGNTIGGAAAGAGNVISGNLDGLDLLSGSGTLVESNYIGTDITGTKAVANIRGIFCRASGDTIGGTAAGAGNVISGNLNNGVELDQGATGDLVQGNRIGTDATGAAPLGNGGVGVAIASSGNTVGGTAVDASNVISANQASGIEIFTGGDNLVQGNLIGTNASGTVALGNFVGIAVDNLARNNSIGGTAPGAGNVISGNRATGVLLSGSSNAVQGNLIGTDNTGRQALGNQNGLVLQSSNNTVGGTATGARNIISGNRADGVLSAGTGQVIEGNYIGTDITGTKALSNGSDGVSAGSNTTIGGTAAGAGNLISANAGNGISLAGNRNIVQGNLIGTDVTGTQALGNTSSGVSITGSNNTIGGTATGAGNLISGNKGNGVTDLAGNANLVEGNYIGTDVTGSTALGNRLNGVEIDPGASNVAIGGTVADAGNVISGNQSDGVLLKGVFPPTNISTGNVVAGNKIGTNATGTSALGNHVFGVDITNSSGNTIGGTTVGARNIISGNAFAGVNITGPGNTVQGNFIGTDVTGTTALGNGRDGVDVTGTTGNVIGGTTAVGAGNVISGNSGAGVVLFLASGNLVQGNDIGTDVTASIALGNQLAGIESEQGSNNTIGGTTVGARNIIAGNGADGVSIDLGSGNLVEGNHIGTDATGTTAIGNGGSGISITSSGNAVGGSAAGAGNVISGNAKDGVHLAGSSNVVEGNYIGTDATGTAALGNGGNGVYIFGLGSRTNNTIGGTAAGARNLISGNLGDGIQLIYGGNDVVAGNYVGTDVTGTAALGNGGDGIEILGSSNNTIGGTTAGAGNLVSGNKDDGVFLGVASNGANPNGNVLQGNQIGAGFTGKQALGNGSDGVAILNGSSNTVGGTTPASANVISANGGSGVLLSGANATSNLIAGNFIGTDASATINLGNAVDGVTIRDASNNTIGGTAPGSGNTIAFNGNDGVLVDTGTGNAILSDLIFSSGHLGIELLNNGNNNQAAPHLLMAHQHGSDTMIVGMLRSTPNTTFTLQLFSDPSPDPSGLGEGQQLLGTFTVTTNAAGIATFVIRIPTVVPAGQIITATATDPNNNTSEFSFPVEVSGQSG